MQLKGKNILITGAATRVGAFLAESLAACGANIILHYFKSRAQVVLTEERCRQAGAQTWLVSADLSTEKGVQTVIDFSSTQVGKVDTLIHNASIYEPISLNEATWQDFQQNHGLHAYSALYLGRWLNAQTLSESLIITILDAGLHRYNKKYVPYQLSKRSLADATQMMAMEFAPRTRVNAIAPGMILPRESYAVDNVEKIVGEVPIPRMGELHEIFHSARFLIENDYVTGQIIYCDGGLHLKGKDLR